MKAWNKATLLSSLKPFSKLRILCSFSRWVFFMESFQLLWNVKIFDFFLLFVDFWLENFIYTWRRKGSVIMLMINIDYSLVFFICVRAMSSFTPTIITVLVLFQINSINFMQIINLFKLSKQLLKLHPIIYSLLITIGGKRGWHKDWEIWVRNPVGRIYLRIFTL